MRTLLALVALFALASGCTAPEPEVRPQWLVHVTTDAPIPHFGSKVLVEVVDGEGVPIAHDAQRFVDAALPGNWPVSFAIVPPASGSTRVRARLLRFEELDQGGLLEADGLIDAVGALPADPVGVTPVQMTLAMACFGEPTDLVQKQTCDPLTGLLGSEPVLTPLDLPGKPSNGTWRPGLDQPCPAHVADGMVCVPGGAFALGSSLSLPGRLPTLPERVVTLDTFFIDRDELTVGAVRATVARGLPPPVERGSSADTRYCTYLGADDPANDELPINCLSRVVAASACKDLGKRLPTEAEWEFAAGNRGLETAFPWGADADVCGRAIVSRGSFGQPNHCLAGSGQRPGVTAGGSLRDATAAGVRNLGGNVAEWVADDFEPYDAPCWAPTSRLLENPSCDTRSALGVVRGGSWISDGFQARVYERDASTGASVAVGARCALTP